MYSRTFSLKPGPKLYPVGADMDVGVDLLGVQSSFSTEAKVVVHSQYSPFLRISSNCIACGCTEQVAPSSNNFAGWHF